MPRIPLISIDEATPELRERLVAERGEPVENIFLALLNAPEVARAVLEMATTLRKRTRLDRRLRELAVLTVGREAGADYEIAHHWDSAVAAGVSRKKLEAVLFSHETDVFTDAERAVIAYARSATRDGRVADAVWQPLTTFLDEEELVELVVTVAWYNGVVRMLLPMQIDIESWYRRTEPDA